MSRRPPSDTFTRFTSTSPHASSNPSSFTYQPPRSSQSSAPNTGFNVSRDGETPAQKVARLRAASRAQKERMTMSTTDRLLARGRVFADGAHRAVAYGLMGFTGIAAVFSIYSLTSLITHNRRQKRAWIDRELEKLRDAQTAFLKGIATPEQLHLLEQERAGEEMSAQRNAEKKRRGEQSMWARVTGFVKSGTSVGSMGRENMEAKEAPEGGQQRLLEKPPVEGQARPQQQALPSSEGVPEGLQPVAVRGSEVRGVGYDERGRPVPANKLQSIPRAVNDERRTGEEEVTARTRITGGPLDVLADNISEKVTSTVSRDRGWLSWLRGSSS